MKFEYKHKNIILAFSILAAIISVAIVIFESVVRDDYVSGSLTTFLVLGGMVLLIIGQFSNFENTKTKSMFTFVAYCIYLIIYGRYFVSTSWGVAFNAVGNQVLRSVNSIFGVFCAISFILLIASLIAYTTSRNPKDSIHLLKISGVLLLVFSSLFCLGDIVAYIIDFGEESVRIELTQSALNSSMYLVISIVVFFMTFFLEKTSYFKMRSESKNSGSSKRWMSEKDKLNTLKKYRELLESGAISKEEFDKKKNEIM